MGVFEYIGDPRDPGPFVFTCEHASTELHFGLEASDGDRALLREHWGSDIGAADVTRTLVARLGGQGVLAGFSRLLVDPNRALADPTLFLERAGDRVVDLNANLTDDDRNERIEGLFVPFHGAVRRVLEKRNTLARSYILVSIHSFTPVWFGQKRELDIGVLFDEHEREAIRVAQALAVHGFVSALNEPYSGRAPNGLIYSARRHAHRARVRYIELEIRQDLISEPEAAIEVAERIALALGVLT